MTTTTPHCKRGHEKTLRPSGRWYCDVCKKARRSTPEHRERVRERQSTPEFREHMREYQREWKRQYRQDPKNRERERERLCEYRLDPKNREKRNARLRERRANDSDHRERLREYNRNPKRREQRSEQRRERYANDPEFRARMTAHQVKRRRLMVGVDAEVFEYEDIFERDGYLCAGCGQVCEEPTLDHVIPLSRGGAHTRANAQTMCGSCNSSKRDRTMPEWLEWLVSVGDERADYVASRVDGVDDVM